MDLQTINAMSARTACSHYVHDLYVVMQTAVANKLKQRLYQQSDLTFRRLHVRFG